MAFFEDKNGKRYNVAITIGSLLRVKRMTGFDLMKLIDFADDGKKIAEQFSDDLELVVNTMYALVSDQCEAAGMTDVQFGESLTGDSIEAGLEAIFRALTDFSPAPRRRVLEKILRMMELKKKRLNQELDKLEAIPDEELEKAFNRQTFGG